jgi:hypothetical protein
MEHEVLLANSDGIPEDVVVVSITDGRYAAFYSVDGATFGVFLNRKGSVEKGPFLIPKRTSPAGEPSRDLVGCGESPKAFWPRREKVSVQATDLSAVVLDNGQVAVAQLARPGPSSKGGAFLALLDSDGVERNIELGPAGEYASRIALVAGDKAIIVAWHDGELGASGIRMERVHRRNIKIVKKVTYRAETAAASPTLAKNGDRVAMAWSETLPTSRMGESVVKVAILRADLSLGAPKTVTTSRFMHPSPSLTVADSGFALVFRDDEDGDDTPEYHFLSLDGAGEKRGARARISTADGLRGPTLVPVDDGFIGATIRSFQRNLLIGLNRMDKRGRKLGGEFQVYADNTDFVRVDIAKNRGKVIIVYAEDRREKGRVLAATVKCGRRH